MGYRSTLLPGASFSGVTRDDTFGSAPPVRPFPPDGLQPLVTILLPTEEDYQQFLESLNVSPEEAHLLGSSASQIDRSSYRAVQRSFAAPILAEPSSTDLQGAASGGAFEATMDGDIEHIGSNHDVQKISIKSEGSVRSATVHTFPSQDNASLQEAYRHAVVVEDGDVSEEIDMSLTMRLDPFVRPAAPGLPPAVPLSLPVPHRRPQSALVISTVPTHREGSSVACPSILRRASNSAETRARKVSEGVKLASKRVSSFYSSLIPVTSVAELPNVQPIYYHPPPRPACAISRPRRIARAFRDKVKETGKDVLARLGFKKDVK